MLKFNSPLEAFLYWEAQTPNAVFLKQPIDGGEVLYSLSRAGEEARKIASALKGLQLPERSHVALLSKNCAHWVMADLAIMMAGYVSIPIYPTLHADSIHQILEHSESKAIIIGKLDNFELQKSGIPDIPKISVSLYGVSESMIWEELLNSQNPLQQIELPESDNLHTIIYTSGTTGNPKGAMHTVGNFVESISTLVSAFNLSNHSTLFSYLPLAHVAERVFITGGIMLGSQICFSESLETFAKDLENTQPHVFFAVPRIWAKFQEKILENMSQNKLNVLLKIPLVNTIVKNKINQKLGLKQAKYIASAAAPLSSSLCRWYKRIDITIYQGYGMTEDCCVSHFNLPGFNKIGTVGRKLNHVQTKLSPEGEILIKNNCLMLGYFKAPDITASVFDDDGYFKTGDIGEYDHEGFLTITGRIKDQFKTDKGKYISPAPLELDISKNTDIEQICVVGTGIPQPIALITLSELGKSKSKTDLCSGLIDTLEQINPKYEKHEKIEKIVIMKEDWNVDNGLTTPTLKVKRNTIEKIHQPYYKQWFESHEKVIFE